MNRTSAVIRRVVLRNFRSIAACDVRLEPFTLLVGTNGSGRSNFLDSLQFVADALRETLDQALRDRGTIRAVRRISGGHPSHLALRFEFSLADGAAGHYAFRVDALDDGGHVVQHEELNLIPGEPGAPEVSYAVQGGRLVAASTVSLPPADPQHLMLAAAAADPAVRPLFELLSGIRVYAPDPARIATAQRRETVALLRRDGANAASVLRQLDAAARDAVDAALARLVPGVQSVEAQARGRLLTLVFRQAVAGQLHPWHFPATSMSDGTLRTLGVLLAIHQRQTGAEGAADPSLVGLDEPDSALHGAAAVALLETLRASARTAQTIVASHRTELLDGAHLEDDAVLAVDNHAGVTRVERIDAAGRAQLRQRLVTADAGAPAAHEDPVPDEQGASQLGLFEMPVDR